MNYYLLPLLICMVMTARSQDYSLLGKRQHQQFTVYYSKGYESRAEKIALLVDDAFRFYAEQLSFRPKVNLLVLAESDWNNYSKFKLVYGMPHFDDQETLIVAAADNAFWKSFFPPLTRLPGEWQLRLKAAYACPDNSISAAAFFDILALHELAHAFHLQAKLNMQRKWMSELFCNIMTHSYIAHSKPALLPALTTFPDFVVAGGYKQYQFTSLQQLENNYDLLGTKYPENYGWYQCNWHKAAAGFYDQEGLSFGPKIWKAFQSVATTVSDEELTAYLKDQNLHPIINMMENWPDFGP